MVSDVSKLLVNVGTGHAISILDLAKMMIRISGLDLQATISEPLEGDIEKSQADTTLFKDSFNWIPTTSLEDWLKETIR